MVTVYFIVHIVENLPAELQKLLKWKMSSYTPNVIRSCVLRSGFKDTDSELFVLF
jgi:hypothetical protein